MINICVPSYKRPTKCDVLKYLPFAKIIVSNDELQEYQEANPNAEIIGVDPKHQGNLCRIRNHILDMYKGNITCIVDDDLKGLAYWEKGERVKLQTEEVMPFLEKYTQLAMDLGVKLWGININYDHMSYREYAPFNFLAYIGGPFMVHIDPELRFDERLPLKEDYDFTLQNLNKYRKVLRVNKFHYLVKQAEQVGGCATYRNIEREVEQLQLLKKKWGSKIVREEKTDFSRGRSTKKRSYADINPIISVPIKGL